MSNISKRAVVAIAAIVISVISVIAFYIIYTKFENLKDLPKQNLEEVVHPVEDEESVDVSEQVIVTPVTETEIPTEQDAVGFEMPVASTEIPEFITSAEAWIDFQKTEFYTEDFTVHNMSDDWITGEYVSDYKAEFEWCNNSLYVAVFVDDPYEPVFVSTCEAVRR